MRCLRVFIWTNTTDDHTPVVCGTLRAVSFLRLLRRHDEHRVFPAVTLVPVDQTHVLRLLHVHLTHTHTQVLQERSDWPLRSGDCRWASDLLHTLVEELEAAVTVADERTLLDELREHLRLRELRVKLLLRSVTRLQEAWETPREKHHQCVYDMSMFSTFRINIQFLKLLESQINYFNLLTSYFSMNEILL